MSLFSKITNFLSGGIGEKIVDTVKEYFPPKLTEAERMRIEEAIRQSARHHELQLIDLAQKEQQEFDQRVRDLEGTAKDLQQFGWIGKIVIFLRGLQRPIWGFFVLILDYNIFSGNWKFSDMQTVKEAAESVPLDLQSAFWVINFLVLGFLFGERAMRNVVPLFKQRMGIRSANDNKQALG